MDYFLMREVLFCSLLVGVFGAGYIGIRPASQNKCRYEDIQEAHFSYELKNCEGKNWILTILANISCKTRMNAYM